MAPTFQCICSKGWIVSGTFLTYLLEIPTLQSGARSDLMFVFCADGKVAVLSLWLQGAQQCDVLTHYWGEDNMAAPLQMTFFNTLRLKHNGFKFAMTFLNTLFWTRRFYFLIKFIEVIQYNQYWFRLWLGAIRHQATTWTNIDQDP